MTNEQRNQLIALRKALDNFVVKIADTPAEINENQIVVRSWKPDTYIIGDVRNYHNIPYKCVQAHDSTANIDWTPEATPSLWMPPSRPLPGAGNGWTPSGSIWRKTRPW